MSANRLKYLHAQFHAMGTACELQIFAVDEITAGWASQAVIADVQRLEAKYSRYKPDSFLSAINRVAESGGAIEVDEETAGLLDYAATCHQQSDGLFDISSGLLRRAWRFDQNTLPEQTAIDQVLRKVGWHKLEWKRPVLRFPLAGMELDFGGIVKEYAADRAATLCLAHGVKHGVVNLGGDINILGPRADGSPWQVGIRHPFATDGLLDTLSVYKGAIASSGDYERCMTIDGIRYGHVLNPKTGWPVSHFAAVSVIADFCVIAGSASTITMLKEQQGEAWLQSLELPYLCIDLNSNIQRLWVK